MRNRWTPSGPPGEQEDDPPIKPAHELLGEVLLEAGAGGGGQTVRHRARAHAQSSQTPPRRGQGRVQVNDQATAQLRYRQLLIFPAAVRIDPGSTRPKRLRRTTSQRA